MNMKKIEELFSGWDETFLWSCINGEMGYVLADHEDNPTAAQIVVGDFCFFAGKPNISLAQEAAAPIMVPKDKPWEEILESVWQGRAEKAVRYATKKEENAFDVQKLLTYAAALPVGYELKRLDHSLYEEAVNTPWSHDLCSQFHNAEDYCRRGIGVGVCCQGRLVAGASSYIVYPGGIEIQIDTMREFRRQGLATACGAKLILECLNRGLYPSWDAYDRVSLSLAEKLGYRLDRPYPVYLKMSISGEN